MRFLILLVSILAAACLVATTPIDPTRILINNPTEGPFSRARRSSQYIKNPTYNNKRHFSTAELNLRKGEYICGNRICKLKPGNPPANCDGCQYPIALTNNMGI